MAASTPFVARSCDTMPSKCLGSTPHSFISLRVMTVDMHFPSRCRLLFSMALARIRFCSYVFWTNVLCAISEKSMPVSIKIPAARIVFDDVHEYWNMPVSFKMPV